MACAAIVSASRNSPSSARDHTSHTFEVAAATPQLGGRLGPVELRADPENGAARHQRATDLDPEVHLQRRRRGAALECLFEQGGGLATA